jgi:DNA adenine methylase
MRAEGTRGIRDLRPPLKWAGGKRWLVPQLLSIWSFHRQRRFVEPFCGGLAVALGLRPHAARLSDANPHLINFYRWVQRGLTVSIPFRNEETLYYRYREDFNDLLRRGKEQSAEAAALFYYLNRTGYNGLCRFNSRGFFNVPFGRYDNIRYSNDFAELRGALSGWSFSFRDFEAIDLRRGDFVYADPPYDVPFTHYSRGGFTWHDQVRLAEWISSHDGPVVLSNQATARIVKLYEQLGFQIAFVNAPRMISCNGDRTKAREVLATRNL